MRISYSNQDNLPFNIIKVIFKKKTKIIFDNKFKYLIKLEKKSSPQTNKM